eukprot:scaffold9442_cov117-Isochrysis_galbana.AAC.4
MMGCIGTPSRKLFTIIRTAGFSVFLPCKKRQLRPTHSSFVQSVSRSNARLTHRRGSPGSSINAHTIGVGWSLTSSSSIKCQDWPVVYDPPNRAANLSSSMHCAGAAGCTGSGASSCALTDTGAAAAELDAALVHSSAGSEAGDSSAPFFLDFGPVVARGVELL